MFPRDTLADDVLQDLRTGMADTALMAKYQLSYTELRALYYQLFVSGRLLQQPPAEGILLRPECRPKKIEVLELSSSRREIDRYRLYFDIPVYERERPEVVGSLCDITESGLGVAGVEAEPDELKILVVEGDTFCDVAPFEVEARCCWIEKDDETEEVRAGFEITDISVYDRKQLDKLIDLAVV